MQITRGLIISDPWISYILDGSKIWEMRSTPTSHRGWFGLIRKGTGEVHGIAQLIRCGAPLSSQELIASICSHRIPERMIRSGEVAKWAIPWELANVCHLPRPVPYNHRSGAVTWVNFDTDVQEALEKHISAADRISNRPLLGVGLTLAPQDFQEPSPPLSLSEVSVRKNNTTATDLVLETEKLLGRSILTPGNLRNSHFYLTGFMDQFPTDAIGGRNKDSRAPREITIDWGAHSPVSSDIDASKRLFRSRRWVRDFFEAYSAKSGDFVEVYSSGPYCVRVSLSKNGSTRMI